MDWFKIWPSAYLNVINRISDGALRGPFSLLILHCLNSGSLPDDDEDIAFLTGMPLEQITSLRPYLKRLAYSENGRLFIIAAQETIHERQEFAAKKAKAGEAGGKQKQANKDNIKQVLAKASSASEKLARPGNGKLRLASPSQTDMQTDMQTDREKKPSPARPVEIDLGSERLDAIQSLVISGCGITFLSDQIERQVITAVGAINQTGESLERIRAFFTSRTKCQAVNYVAANFMQWAGSQKRTTESEKPVTPKYKCAQCKDLQIIFVGGKRTECPCFTEEYESRHRA